MKLFLTVAAFLISLQFTLYSQCLTTTDFPFNTDSGAGASWSAGLYSPERIGGAQTFSKLSLEINNVASGTFTYDNVRILMRETPLTSYPNGSYPGTAGFTEVFNGPLTFTARGLHTITLSAPFPYSGNNSLEVLFLNNPQDGNPSNEPAFVRTKLVSQSPGEPYIGKHGTGTSNGTRRQYQLVINSINCDLSPLPVSLLYFTAECTDRSIVLHWGTSEEMQNAFFLVQHSKDGQHWETKAKVAGAGDAKKLRAYTVTDETPGEGISYYRLVQTDLDGRTTTYNILSQKCTSTEAAIYPSPFEGTLSVQVDDFADMRAELYDLSGRKLEVPYTLNTGKLVFHTHALPKGVYLVRLYRNEAVKTIRVVK